MTQSVAVLDLPPEILECVDVETEDIPEGVSMTRLRAIAACGDRGRQLRRFRALVGE